MKTKTKKKTKVKTKKPNYCNRCGVLLKTRFHIQLTLKKTISVCNDCFDWSMDKTHTEIKKDYSERSSRKRKK